MTDRGAHVAVIGAGIAGASAAYFAARAGWRVTLIDAARDRASDVPSALINCMRGRSGKIIERGPDATRFTFGLIETLIDGGHRIPHGRGLWRPVPDAATRAEWEAVLNQVTDLPHSWHALPSHLGLSGAWHSALYLPESGWVESAAMLAALVAASGATRITAMVEGHPVPRGNTVAIALEGQPEVVVDRALWCGGALGAAQNHLGRCTYRPGSVLSTDAAFGGSPFSFGLYCAPHRSGAVIGPTSEPRTPHYEVSDQPKAIERLRNRIEEMWTYTLGHAKEFRAARLESPPDEPHCEALTGFGGRGFLMAPIAASRWATTL